MRRTRFEAKLLAQEVVGALAQAMGGEASPSTTPPPARRTVPPKAILTEMGIELPT